MFVKYFKQSKFLTKHLSLMPQACTTVTDRRSAYFTARLQKAGSAGVRSRLTVGFQWLEAGRATSC